MILNRFQYNNRNTECKLCVAYQKNKGCTKKSCPWLDERLAAGAVPNTELLKVCFEKLQNKKLKNRLRLLASGYCTGWFYDTAHRLRFEHATAALPVSFSTRTPNYAAVLFLLTADEQLWRCAEKGTTFYTFRFDKMKLRNITTDAYALYQAAKSIYTGKPSITAAELADPELIDGPLFTTIVNGILIDRFGTDVFKLTKTEVYL